LNLSQVGPEVVFHTALRPFSALILPRNLREIRCGYRSDAPATSSLKHPLFRAARF